MKLLRSSAKTSTETYSEVKRSVWLSNKLKIMSRSSTIVQAVAVAIQVDKSTNKTAGGYNYVRQWASNKLIGFTTFHPKNALVNSEI